MCILLRKKEYNYATAALVLWRQRCQKNIIGSHSAVNHFDFALTGNKSSSDPTFSGSFIPLHLKEIKITASLVHTVDVCVVDSDGFRRKLMR